MGASLKRLDAEAIGALLDVPSAHAARELEAHDFDLRYEPLSPSEQSAALAQVEQALEVETPAPAGPQRAAAWEQGWEENLAALQREGVDAARLRPRYFRRDLMRLCGEYVRPVSASFEPDFFQILRRLVFRRWLSDAASVIEFGCGTGANLLDIASLSPQARLIGTDWAKSSQLILEMLARKSSLDLHGVHLDMFHPREAPSLPVTRPCAALSVHAFEQLGTNFTPMLNFLLEFAPEICVQIEPVLELYDGSQPMDALAIRYHRRRNYLEGYLEALRGLERSGRIQLDQVRRIPFGSRYHEAYNLLVWRPA